MDNKEKLKIAAIIIFGFILICGTMIFLDNTSQKIYMQYLKNNNLPLIRDNCTLYYNNMSNLWEGVNCTCSGCYGFINKSNFDNYSEIIYGDGERRSGWTDIGTRIILNETGGNETN